MLNKLTKEQQIIYNDHFIKINDNRYHCLLKGYSNVYTLKEVINIIKKQLTNI